MRLINLHFIHHYQLSLLLIVLLITVNYLQLINCNSTDSDLTLFPHQNQTLIIVNQSETESSSTCNQSDTITIINLKTINLTVNFEDETSFDKVSNDTNNLTQQLNIGRINHHINRNNNNQSFISVNYSSFTIDNQLNHHQQSGDNNLTTITPEHHQQSTTIKPQEKLIIRLKRARGRRPSTFGTEDRVKAQGTKSSGQSTILHQQLAVTINSLPFGIIIEILLIIKCQLNQFYF